MRYFIFFLGLFLIGSISYADEIFPRFASLRVDEVNMRTGPGERFPISWVYKKMGWPVEVLDEFDLWRKVRDIDGTEGWVHRRMISSKRTALTPKDKEIPLYWKHTKASPMVALLKGGLVVDVEFCQSDDALCKVEIQGIKGYVDRTYLWGIYSGEVIK